MKKRIHKLKFRRKTGVTYCTCGQWRRKYPSYWDEKMAKKLLREFDEHVKESRLCGTTFGV